MLAGFLCLENVLNSIFFAAEEYTLVNLVFHVRTNCRVSASSGPDLAPTPEWLRMLYFCPSTTCSIFIYFSHSFLLSFHGNAVMNFCLKGTQLASPNAYSAFGFETYPVCLSTFPAQDLNLALKVVFLGHEGESGPRSRSSVPVLCRG